jgi:hypothetical protein
MRAVLLLASLFYGFPARLPADDVEARPPATAEVLALFQRRCVECHGPAKQSGKLRLDGLDALFRGGRSGPAVAAGRSAESLLFQRISPQAEKRMPPEEKGDPLGARELDLVRRWIDAGARAEPSAKAAPAAVALAPGALPPGFAPLFSIAGEASGPRLALGRGAAVEAYELSEPEGREAKAELKALARLEGHADLVQSLAFSQDGKRLASGEYRAVRLWSVESWELLRLLSPHADRVLALAFSPDGKRLAAAGGAPSESGEIKVWDLESGEELWSAAPHSDTVFGIDWSADGRTLFSGGADRVIYLLEAESGKLLRRLEGHTHHVLAVALSPDGKRAASAGADELIRLWDLENGTYLRSIRGHGGAVTAVAFRDDGRQLASVSADATARFWNAENGGQQRAFSEAKGWLQGGAFFLGGKRYAAAEQDGAVRVYDLERNRLLLTLEPRPGA